ncbi:MAG: hypothetical protein NTV88_03420 [Candidatus Micrarchaeota archaeon]|nr:hypothetical protein [Candidatus Micrarchaeota archaeon]
MNQKLRSNQYVKSEITRKVIDNFKVKLLGIYDEKSGRCLNVFIKNPIGTAIYTDIAKKDKTVLLAYLNRNQFFSREEIDALEVNGRLSAPSSSSPRAWQIMMDYDKLPSYLKN